MGREYTRAMVTASRHIDAFIDINDFLSKEVVIDHKKPAAIVHLVTNKLIARRAKELKIPIRIGTTGRIYHWFTCNKLVPLSRNKSPLHEAQLNLKLLQPLGITGDFSLDEIAGWYGLDRLEPLEAQYAALVDQSKYNLVIHPKSQGNAREWPADHFIKLINALDGDTYNILISGVEKEKTYVQQLIAQVNKPVKDIAGVMPLGQFISFMHQCDGVVANSTGPLHIGAALGKDAIGIYPPLKPKHPGRWGPIGMKAQVFVLEQDCTDCRKTVDQCHCISSIEPFMIKAALDKCVQAKGQPVLK